MPTRFSRIWFVRALIAACVSACAGRPAQQAAEPADPSARRREQARELQAAGSRELDVYRPEAAAKKYREALEILEATDGVSSSSLAGPLRGLAAAAKIQCRPELARDWLQRAERVADVGAETIAVNRAYALLGDWIGDGDLAWSRILRTDQLCRQTFGREPRCTRILVDSATIGTALGYLEESRLRLEAAFAEVTDESGDPAMSPALGMYLFDEIVFHLHHVYGLLGEESKRREFERRYQVRHASSEPRWPSREALKPGRLYCREPLSLVDIEGRVSLRREWIAAISRCYKPSDSTREPGLFTAVAYQADGLAIAAEVQGGTNVSESAMNCALKALLAQRMEPFGDGFWVGFYTHFARVGSRASMGYWD